MEVGRILQFDAQLVKQMAVQLINACILAFALSKILYNPVKNFLHARKERISQNIKEAKEALEHAEDTKLFYEEKKDGIDFERKEIIDAAKKRALELEERIIGEARKEAAAIIERTQREMAKAKEDSREEIRKYIVEISAIIAERYVQEKMDERTGNRLLDEAIDGLGDSAWLN